MTPLIPITCLPNAFKLLAAQLPSLQSSDALLQGAVAISLHQCESITPADIDAKIQSYADTIRARVRGRQPQAVLAHLHEFLFEEQKFGGDRAEYSRPAGCYLPMVLDSKRGLPVTLSLLYKVVAERLGLRVRGINLPGHFIVGIETGESLMLVDPFFGGREVSVPELHARMQEIFGEEVELSDELLAPTTTRVWLTRILQTLLSIFGSAGNYLEVAAVLEMEMVLWPQEARLQRDLALVLARCGLSQSAWQWLDSYLKAHPEDPQEKDLKQLLEVLGT